MPEALEGDSLKEQVLDPASAGQPVARSQYPRGKLMGRSIRTDRYRYTEWQEKTTGAIAERDLYDYQTIPRKARTWRAALRSRRSSVCKPNK